MENLTFGSLKQAIELGEELHKGHYGLDLETAISRAKDIIIFDNKIEELGDKYIGKGGIFNRRIKITGEFGDKAEKVFINGRLKGLLGMEIKDKCFYYAIICTDNHFYSDKTDKIAKIPEAKIFYPYTKYEGENGETFPFKIKEIDGAKC